MAHVAEASYPNVWPEFLEGLMTVWQSSPDGTAEMCMMVLRNIAEDCTDKNFNASLSASLRNVLLKAVNVHLDALLSFTFQYMHAQYTTATGLDVAQVQAARGAPPCVKLLKAGLAMLLTVGQWVPLEAFITPAHDFIGMYFALLAAAPTSPVFLGLRGDVMHCLRTLTARKLGIESIGRIVAQLPQVLQNTPQPSHQTEHLSFWRSVGSCVNDLVSLNAATISEDANLAASDEFQQFMAFCVMLLSHPSPHLASEMTQMWCAVGRMRRARGMEDGRGMCIHLEAIFNAYWPRTLKIILGAFDEGAMDDIYEEEFADEDDIVTFVGLLRGQLSGLLRLCGEFMSPYAIRALGTTMKVLISAAPTDYLEPRTNRVTFSTTLFRQLEAFAVMVESVYASVPDQEYTSPGPSATCQHTLELMDMVLGWGPTDPLMRCMQMVLLTHMRGVLKFHPARISPVLECIFAALQATDGPGYPTDPNQLSEVVQKLRRKAGSCLVNFARAIPEQLEPHIEGLAQRVGEMISSKTLANLQEMHCIEMLATVATAVAAPARKASIINAVAGNSLRDLQSPELMGIIESPTSLLTGGMALGEAGTPEVVARGHERIGSISSVLSTLQAIARRIFEPDFTVLEGDAAARNPFFQLWPQILPNLCRLIESIHGIWAPPIRDQLLMPGPPTSHVLGLPEQELRLKSTLSAVTQPKTDGSRAPIEELRPRWLNEIRVQAYILLGTATTHVSAQTRCAPHACTPSIRHR